MITLKLASYNPEECNTLAAVLRKTAEDLCNKSGTPGKCNLCPVRKICKDLAKASDFADQQARMMYNGK